MRIVVARPKKRFVKNVPFADLLLENVLFYVHHCGGVVGTVFGRYAAAHAAWRQVGTSHFVLRVVVHLVCRFVPTGAIRPLQMDVCGGAVCVVFWRIDGDFARRIHGIALRFVARFAGRCGW